MVTAMQNVLRLGNAVERLGHTARHTCLFHISIVIEIWRKVKNRVIDFALLVLYGPHPGIGASRMNRDGNS